MPFSYAGDESGLARHLLATAGPASVRRGHPVWALVRGLPDGDVELAVPADDFDGLGWVAPPEFDGIGIVATGRLRQLDPSVELAASLVEGLSGSVTMACLVLRSGRIGWHMTLPDGSSFAERPEEGRMLDVLHRCLGLATPPPPSSVDPLYNLAWMGHILDTAVPGRLLSWPEVLALHPALMGRACVPDPCRQEQLIEVLTCRDSWESVRAAVAGGLVGDGLAPPHLAAWMDAGMFARWVLGAIRPAEDMLMAVRPYLRPSAARRLAHRVVAAR